jgi:hypothetical protein
VAQFESGGRASAVNPFNSQNASGPFQISDPTWLGTYRAMHPGVKLSDQQILALKSNPDWQGQIMTGLTVDNIHRLDKAGIPITDGTKYAMHFLGAGTGLSVLQADDNTPLIQALGKQGAAIYAQNPVLARNGIQTVGQFKQWAQAVGDGSFKPGMQFPGGGGAGSLFGLPGYNTQYDQQALQGIQSAVAQAQQGQSAAIPYEKPPELGAPEIAPPTDFSKADAALQAMTPTEVTEAEKRRWVSSNLLRGAAQALTSLPEGAGLGKVLAAFGGGMMSGAVTGEDKVDKELEEYQNKMAQFHAAVYHNETAKAEDLSRWAQNKANAINEVSRTNYVTQVNDWAKTHNVQVTPQGISYTTMSPDGKSIIAKTVPNAGVLALQGAVDSAGIYQHMGTESQAAANADRTLALGLMRIAGLQSKNQMGDPAGMLMNAGLTARLAVQNGRAPHVFGPAAYAKVEQGWNDYYKQNFGADMASMPMGSKAYNDRKNEYIIQILTQQALTGGDHDLNHRLYSEGQNVLGGKLGDSMVRKGTGQQQAASPYAPEELMASLGYGEGP